ncbi:hypothetical protein HZH68_016965 [Vespula germanica]|uniref:Uncharacterized protein n=1 Tax=Vespula germanica TaxID=30212 RepID=A0A834IZ98_VESGE|nr:hypothetical protein HZH68_016965 [Vespula germanica]
MDHGVAKPDTFLFHNILLFLFLERRSGEQLLAGQTEKGENGEEKEEGEEDDNFLLATLILAVEFELVDSLWGPYLADNIDGTIIKRNGDSIGVAFRIVEHGPVQLGPGRVSNPENVARQSALITVHCRDKISGSSQVNVGQT